MEKTKNIYKSGNEVVESIKKGFVSKVLDD
jgi:hypothetical protein